MIVNASLSAKKGNLRTKNSYVYHAIRNVNPVLRLRNANHALNTSSKTLINLLFKLYKNW